MDIPSDQVRIAFLGVGESKVELVEPTDDTTGVARFLASKGEGFHHVCFEVANLAETLLRLEIDGLELIDSAPRRGAEGPVAFLHPRSCHGVLVELIEAPGGPSWTSLGLHRGARPMTDDFATAIDASVPPSGPRLRRVRGDRLAGGSTCGAARSAGTSAAATPRRRSTPGAMRPPAAIRWSAPTSRTRTGSTASSPTTPTRGRSWRRRSPTRSTRRSPGPADRVPDDWQDHLH